MQTYNTTKSATADAAHVTDTSSKDALRGLLGLYSFQYVRRHCLLQVYHEMVLLERIHSMPELSQAASLQAVTSSPLSLY